MATDKNGAIEHKAYARVGLLGDLNDVYRGRTISFSLGNFWASVRLEPSKDLLIVPHPTHDLVQFDSFPHLTGLSGSSAIVYAALSCLLDFYRVRNLIKVEVRPNLILSAEKERGIVAGLQDRVAQVYGGLIYMDFDKKFIDNLGHGEYIPMDVGLLPPLYLIYAKNLSDSGKVTIRPLYLIYAKNPSDSGKVHNSDRQRWLNGYQFIISSVEEVTNIALEGRTALIEKDYAKLASLMNRNFDLRRQMFGDDALGALNIEMVEVDRRVGTASKFTGSGGAVIVFCPDRASQVKRLEDACKKACFVYEPVQVIPSLLNEIDLGTL